MMRNLIAIFLAIVSTCLNAGGFTEDDYKKHLINLQKTLPKGFSIVVQKPFVVVGDESEAMVKKRAEGTVRWAVKHFKKEYFAKDPEDIINIWLFKDKKSYMRYTQELFNDEPTTPYGYYSPSKKILVMNISTGGGTLVHEILHPFMASNFPGCPSWFNEGLASLYEQCGTKGGRIHGFLNWRLPILQKAIKNKTTVSFVELMAMNRAIFYAGKGSNYAQSRYLCYYLQEKGLLQTYYHDFHKNSKDDPTGYKTLQKLLKEKDMKSFQQRFEKWILTLKR